MLAVRPICWKISRFLLAGGIGALINLALLYLLTEVVGWYYLCSATLSFAVAVTASFILQKFWTFADGRLAVWRHQALVFALVALINTGVNTLIVYGLVEVGGLHYLISQIVASVLIAFESFWVYHLLIFKLKIQVVSQL